MGRSPESAPLRMMHHSTERCWRAVVVFAMLAVVGTANSADAPPLLVPEQMSAGEIQLALQKLNVLGRVLYIAAHPDDENTNLMALWANGSLYDAAYLSLALRLRLPLATTDSALRRAASAAGVQIF